MARSRIAVFSDVHAHLIALEAVLSDARAVGVDGYACLGDIIDMGPQPNEVVARIRALDPIAVGGNHDPLDEHPAFPKLAEMEAWTDSILAPEARAWLAALPTEAHLDLEGAHLWFAHGAPHSNTAQVLADTPEDQLRAWLAAHPFDLYACGHTHVQTLRRLDGRAVINVGSVGIPFEGPFRGGPPRGLPWAEYAIVEAEAGRVSVQFRQVPYDFVAFRRVMYTSGAPSPAAWLSDWGPSGP